MPNYDDVIVSGGPNPFNALTVWVVGVIDELDPVNADGTPKHINDASITWELYDSDGNLLATDVAEAKGNGSYRCDIFSGTPFQDGQKYLFRVVGVAPGDRRFVVERTITARMRLGKTALR